MTKRFLCTVALIADGSIGKVVLDGAKLFFVATAKVLLVCAMPLGAHASLSDEFTAYYTDVDGDGLEDVFFQSDLKIVLIAGDIVIPIDISDPAWLLKAGGSLGEFSSAVETNRLSSITSLLPLTLLELEVDGDPATIEYLVQAQDSGVSSLILSVGADGVPIVREEIANSLIQGNEMDANVASVSIVDSNGDGKDDIVIDYGAGTPQFIAYADPAGFFTSEETDPDIASVWFGFKQALMDNDLGTAVLSFSEAKQDRYQQVLSNVNGSLSSIATQVRGFKEIYLDNEIAIYGVNRTIGGQDMVFFATFRRDDLGNWTLESI